MTDTAIACSFISVVLVSLCSLVGIILLWLRRETLNYTLILLVSFSSGALFGDAFIHLLPQTVEQHGFTLAVSLFTLLGVAGSFFLEKVVHWRHDHSLEHSGVESFAYMNLLGDGVHNLVDGVVITAAFAVDIGVGVATAIAVLFHEIPQEMGDFGVLIHGGVSRDRAILLNLATTATALLGVGATVLLIDRVDQIVAFLVPFAAGTFIYIAGSDLIPQLHKKREVADSLLQLLFFGTGIGLMIILR